MNLTIKALTRDLEEEYFDFFDNRAFSDGSPYYPCYCNAFNMSKEQISTELLGKAESYGAGIDGCNEKNVKRINSSCWGVKPGNNRSYKENMP